MRHKDTKVIKAEDGNPALHPLHLKSSLGEKINRKENITMHIFTDSDGSEIRQCCQESHALGVGRFQTAA